MRPDLHRSLTTDRRNRSPPFSASGCAETKIGMKRRRIEQEGMMSAENTLKKRKKEKYPLGTGADVGAQEIKEKDILDESEPIASLTLSGKVKTAMIKRIKLMALVCSIYDVNFRNSVETHYLDVEEDLSENVDFVQAN